MCGGCGVVRVGDWEGEGKEARVSKFGMEEQNRRWGKGFGKFFFCKICEHVSVKRVWIV